ncbi:MAG: universal stress protein [Deltaproteobacteria bacterium]|nr:universal stress protein [Deltaproteobacteria bacterium]
MTLKLQKILSPIQFNDQNSLDALDLAQQFASKNESEIVLLHVIPRSMVKPDLPGYQDLFADNQRKVADELERIATHHLAGCPHQVVVKSGDPAETIVRVAQELGADLIVMATHGRRGLSHLVMGSVAERVLREAPCLVLTKRPGAPAK